ncbi:MAG: hypothetical protein LH702_04415 [Phormidesmis sp. CAN_BIN44]|nr:hypothetical protein [Phormidesmis sp. CAN_BIN44]
MPRKVSVNDLLIPKCLRVGIADLGILLIHVLPLWWDIGYSRFFGT